MNDRDHNAGRRGFLKFGAYGLLAVPMAGLGWSTTAQAMERLDEGSAQAEALDYVHAASDADHDAYEEGQVCSNCDLWTDPSAEGWGPCAVFPGSLVAEGGWCSAWVG